MKQPTSTGAGQILSGILLIAGALVITGSCASSALAAPTTCPRFEIGKRVTGTMVDSLKCHETFVSELFKAGNEGLKDGITNCKQVAMEPPDQQHWELVEEEGTSTQQYAEVSLGPSIQILPAFSNTILASSAYYAKKFDQVAVLHLTQAAQDTQEGARDWERAKSHLATAGSLLKGHSCTAAEDVEKLVKKEYDKGSKSLTKANLKLLAVAGGK